MTDSSDDVLCCDSSVGTNTLMAAKGGEAWAKARICDVYRRRSQCWVKQQGVRGTDADDDSFVIALRQAAHHEPVEKKTPNTSPVSTFAGYLIDQS